MSNNTITEQGVNCEYEAINKEEFYNFLKANLKQNIYYDYNAFLAEAENDLRIGNSCYELNRKYTKSGDIVYYDFFL